MLFKNLFKLSPKPYPLSLNHGFTLVEILIAISVLAALVGGLIIAINPSEQREKSLDSSRQKDISEIKKALDLYYHDKNCYPTQTAFDAILSSGGEWSEQTGNVVYMKKVPKDPKGTAYFYKTDVIAKPTCPQWAVVFAGLSKANTMTATCSLDRATCFPGGTLTGNWACATAGYTDCKLLAGTSIATIPDPESTPTTAPGVPTPTPAVLGSFDVLMNSLPQFTTGILTPYEPATITDPVNLQINVQDLDSSGNALGNITSVKATVSTDTKIKTYNLIPDSGGVLSNNLVGYWKMDDPGVDTEGEVITDSSGSGNSGVLYGNNGVGDNGSGVNCTVPGKYGTACELDGVDDYINAPIPSVLSGASAFSVSFWAKQSAYSWVQPALALRTSSTGDANNLFILYPYDMVDGNGSRIWFNGGNIIDINGTSIPSNQWNHFVYVQRSASDGELFVNGTSVAVNSIPKTLPAVANLTIGSWDGTSQFYNGQLDEIRLYNRALSSSEILDLYNLVPSTVNTSKGKWKLSTPFTTNDTINNNYKITLEANDDAGRSSSVTISVK